MNLLYPLIILLCIIIRTPTYAICQEKGRNLQPDKITKEKIIYVTEISTNIVKNEKIFRIVLNNAIEINDIKIKKYSSSNIIVYPYYISETTGKEFKQVRVVSAQAKKAIEDAIFNNKTCKEIPSFGPMSFNITKLRLHNKKGSPVKAFVTVVFNDAIEVEVRVMSGKYGLWVAYPTRNITTEKIQKPQWLQQFNIIDKELKQKVNTAILNRYREIELEEPEN